MHEDTIIQKNLFAFDSENNNQNEKEFTPEDFSTEELEKESKKRPRQRKTSTNLINKFKTNSLINEKKNDFINEKSFSYKTVEKLKLTPLDCRK